MATVTATAAAAAIDVAMVAATTAVSAGALAAAVAATTTVLGSGLQKENKHYFPKFRHFLHFSTKKAGVARHVSKQWAGRAPRSSGSDGMLRTWVSPVGEAHDVLDNGLWAFCKQRGLISMPVSHEQ